MSMGSEMCHNAGLLQDDFIDNSDTRRGAKAAHLVYGGSNVIYASNFIIARAISAMGHLEKPYMNQLFSEMNNNIVIGELMQSMPFEEGLEFDSLISNYVGKTFYKTSCLMALAARGIGIVHGMDDVNQKKLFDFGVHFGTAFQVHDDILDFVSSGDVLGKPACNDMKEGLVTIPTLFAIEEYRQHRDESLALDFEKRCARQFSEEGDVETGTGYVFDSSGIDHCNRMTLLHVEAAINCLRDLDGIDVNNKYLKALQALTLKVKLRQY